MDKVSVSGNMSGRATTTARVTATTPQATAATFQQCRLAIAFVADVADNAHEPCGHLWCMVPLHRTLDDLPPC
jgi:hypothetical protein